MDKRQEILETVTEIVHSKGYNGTSIQDILQATHMGKGQFYYYFSSKQELGLALIDYCFQKWHQRVIKNILETENPPKVKLNRMLDCALDIHQKNGGKCGCFFGNLAIELSEHNELFRQKLNQVFEVWIDHLAVLFAEIAAQEELPIQTDSQILAQSVVAMIEGGILLMKNRQDVQTLENVFSVIKKMINSDAVLPGSR